jgi:flagellar biosynthesis protein FlhG
LTRRAGEKPLAHGVVARARAGTSVALPRTPRGDGADDDVMSMDDAQTVAGADRSGDHGERMMGNAIATETSSGGPPLRVIAVASGKGGVGKTVITVNLALALARQGRRVCVLDANLALADVGVALGLTPALGLRHVLRGERRLADVVVEGPGGVRVIPAANGGESPAPLGAAERLRLLDEIDALDGALDVLLLDTAAGLSPDALYFTGAAADVLVVVTPEPAALADAAALMEVLSARHGRWEFLITVNMAASAADADATFRRLARAAERLRVRLEYQGWVPDDAAVRRAVRERTGVVLAAPETPASVALGDLAARLDARPAAVPTGGVQFFFQRLLGEGRPRG